MNRHIYMMMTGQLRQRIPNGDAPELPSDLILIGDDPLMEVSVEAGSRTLMCVGEP